MAFASSFLGSACPIVILSPSLRSRINSAKNLAFQEPGFSVAGAPLPE